MAEEKTVAITLTAGEQSENHAGMKQYGDGLAETGFSIAELSAAEEKWEAAGCAAMLIRLDRELKGAAILGATPAAVLVVKAGVDKILAEHDKTADDLFAEQMSFQWDTTYWDTRRKRVLNKIARHNVCFGDTTVPPDIANKQGTIMGYDELPVTAAYRAGLQQFFGDKATTPELEGNKYYDVSKCGIGPHGDGERRRVIGCRLGAQIPLQFKWFHRSWSFGPVIDIDVRHGDVYAMSEKAAGTDWKKSSIKTLRHCAGASKYLMPALEAREKRRHEQGR